MKKTISLLFIVVFLLTVMSVPAMAAGTNSITVNQTLAGETLTLYKMFDLTVDDESDPAAFKYTVNSAWTAFFTTGDGAAYIDIDATDGHVTWKTGMDSEALMIALGQKAAAAAASAGISGTSIVAQGTSVTFNGLDPGYYLITSTLGTKAIIDTTPTNPAPSINEKNPTDTLVKSVKEDDTGTFGTENDVQVGDTVEYKTVVSLAPYTRNVKLYDTMSSGLSYNGDLAIAGLTAGTHYTVTAPGVDEEGNATAFTVTFTEAYLKSIEPTPAQVSPAAVDLTVTYTATVTGAAIASGPSFATLTNTTHLSFGADQTSAASSTTTKTYKFAINKYAEGKTDLGGAVFSLKRNGTVQTLVMIDATNYRVATAAEISAAGANVKAYDDAKTLAQLALAAGDVTNYLITTDTGDITIWGVDSDTNDAYTLAELRAPAGYNKLAADVSVTVNPDNTTCVDVLNQTGTELPSTGGIGTTLFYVVGGLMVAGALVLLISKKRRED